MRITTLAIICLVATSSALADLTEDVRCREIGFSKAAEARDLNAFRSFIDADARFVAGDVRRGVDEVAAAWAPFFAADGPAIRWRPSVVEVLDDGRLALSRGPYRVIAINAEGETVEYWGTFNSVWRLNEDGVWRVVFDAGSPAESPPDETTQALLNAEDGCP